MNVHVTSEAQRLLDAHEVADRASVSLRQAQIHSATLNCDCGPTSVQAFTTREAALREIHSPKSRFRLQRLKKKILFIFPSCSLLRTERE